jgi:hypothetical protein
VAQVVELLPSKQEALSSDPTVPKRRKEGREGGREKEERRTERQTKDQWFSETIGKGKEGVGYRLNE